MANVVGDIAISVGADISPLVSELGKASKAVSKFGGDIKTSTGSLILATAAGELLADGIVSVAKSMVAFTLEGLKNIDMLSKQARVAGLSVAQFQAMSLVAEEAGVSSESLSKNLVKMQNNLVDLGKGTKTQVEAFGALGLSYSQLEGLDAAGQFELIAEKISTISDPAQKTAAALDIFGKSGAEALLMMPGYSAALANATKFQKDFGLAVSDVDAKQIEAANDAIGRTTTALSSLSTELAVTFAPAIEMVALGLAGLVHDVLGVESALDGVFGSGEIAKAILGEDIYNQLNRDAEAFKKVAIEVGTLAGTLRSLEGVVDSAATSFDFMGQRLSILGAGDLAQDFYDLSAGVQQTQTDFDNGAISIDDYRAKLEASRDRATELLVEASKIDGVDLSAVKGQVAALGVVLELAAGKAFALRSALGSGGISGVGAGASASANIKIGNAPTTSIRPERAPNGVVGEDWAVVNDSGGGGGGSDKDFADELKRMQDQFATKTELEQSQYEAQLASLEEFRNNKLLKEGEFNDLEKKIKEEHEKKMADLEAQRRSERLDAISGALGDVASLMQTGNAKLFKIGQAAAIAQSVVTGYQAAVDAWQKGMKIGGPPVAAAFAGASLLKTGVMISKIASQSANGGGTTSNVGGGSGSAAIPQAAPQTSANITLNGDTFSRASVESLFTQINAGLKQGRVINLVRG